MKLDAGEDDALREMNDGGIPYEGSDIVTPKGTITGERRSMYLRRSDFEKYGFSDGCPGCRDIAIQRPGPSSGWSAHNPACRKRMEDKIKEAKPSRWKIHLLRRRDEDRTEEAGPTSTGGPSLATPALEPRERRDLKRGNEDPSQGHGPASIGGLVPGDGNSSTRREPSEVRREEEPEKDAAGFLFGPDGEDETETRGSIATLTGPMVVSGAIGSDRPRVVNKTD